MQTRLSERFVLGAVFSMTGDCAVPVFQKPGFDLASFTLEDGWDGCRLHNSAPVWTRIQTGLELADWRYEVEAGQIRTGQSL